MTTNMNMNLSIWGRSSRLRSSSLSDLSSSNESLNDIKPSISSRSLDDIKQSISSRSLEDISPCTSTEDPLKPHPVKRYPKLTTLTDEHIIPLEELEQRLHTNIATGLSSKQAKTILKHNGRNSFQTPTGCVTSSLIGKLSPSSRRKKFTKSEWQRLVTRRIPTKVVVIRDATTTTVLGKDLVVGDVVVLTANDVVPADIRLTDSNDVIIDNQLITGHRMAARTHRQSEQDCLLSPNMVFLGTRVLRGRGTGVVLKTGEDTVFGSLKNFAVRVRFEAVR